MQVDQRWTLFLDRDGVINDEIKDSYVLDWEMFRFSAGVTDALAVFAQHFGRIVVVTNQRCIGRGLLTEAGLAEIHARMCAAVQAAGGRIDKVYYCPDVDNSSPCRKPQTGMAALALEDFPEIDLQRAVMVGNTLSDMQFGKSLGMTTVFIPSTRPETPFPHPLIDQRCDSLFAFSRQLQ